MRFKKKTNQNDHFIDFEHVKDKLHTKDKGVSYKSKIKKEINPFKESKKTSKFSFFKKSKKSNFKNIDFLHSLFSSKKRFKYMFIIFLILLLLFLYKPLLQIFYSYLYQYPQFAALFSDISREWQIKSLKGLFVMSTLGTLFFVSIPSELIFIQYLSTHISLIIIILVSVVATTLAMIFNYGFGYVFGQYLMQMLLKQRYDKYQDLIQNYASIVIVIGNIIPCPIELISVVFGASKYSFEKYIYLTLISRIMKYLLMAYLAFQFPWILEYFVL